MIPYEKKELMKLFFNWIEIVIRIKLYNLDVIVKKIKEEGVNIDI